MNEQWQQRTVGEILRLEYGKPLPRSYLDVGGKYPVYGANGEKERSNHYYHDRPSIIVGRKGSAGKLELSDGAFWPLDVTYFVVFDEEQYDLQFLYHLLSSLDIPKLAKGVKPGINRNDVYALSVKVPPIGEQKRTVQSLDEAFERIATAKANAEKNVRSARALFESHLASIYAEGSAVWPAIPLGEICDVLDNLRKPVITRDRVVGPYPYYGATGVVDHVADFLFDEPLVLVGEDGAKWGPGEKSAFLVSGKVWVNNHAHVIRPDRQRVLDQWLVFYLTQTDLNGYVSGLTVPKLNQRSLRKIPIPLPGIAEQQRIVDTMKELEASTNHLAETYAAKLSVCEVLSASLLKQAVSGKLKSA